MGLQIFFFIISLIGDINGIISGEGNSIAAMIQSETGGIFQWISDMFEF